MIKLSESISKKTLMDTSNWKPFYINVLFCVCGTKTTSKNILKNKGNGIYPYITTSATNNGVDGLYDFFTEEGNVLVVDSAVGGYMSYQEINFSASDHVEKLVPKFKITKNIALFICCIWNSSYAFKKYNYTRKASQKLIKDEIIFLPVDKNGEPDWKYMEDCMRERERKQY